MLDIEKLATFLVNLMKNTMSPVVARLKAFEETVTGIDARLKEVDEKHREMFLEIGRFKDFDPKSVWSKEQIESLVSNLIDHQSKNQPEPVDNSKEILRQLEQSTRELVSTYAAAIRKEFKEYLESIPPAEPGKSVTVEEVLPHIETMLKELGNDLRADLKEHVNHSVSLIPTPADGIGVAGALIDRAGELVLTLSNGEIKHLGRVVGVDADMEEIKEKIKSEVASIPRPKDGVDGLGFDDLSVECDGKRTFTLRFEKDNGHKKEFVFKLPVMIHQGVYKSDVSYDVGDCVTWAGSTWHCVKEGTTSRPGEDNKDWTLAVKRGRNGDTVVRHSIDSKKPVKMEG